jgi:hypothetical protein
MPELAKVGPLMFTVTAMGMIAQCFWVDWNQFSGAIFLLGIVKFNNQRSLCNTQQLTRPPYG